MTERPHGYARYKLDNCRCYTCAWAVAQYNDHRDHAIRRGTWHPWTDATPARQHILALKACGLGDRRIAELAGLDRSQIRTILHGRPDRDTPPPARIRPATAAAILAVDATLDNLPDAAVIDSTTTVRRLQALVAAGWPQARIAAELGVTPGNFATAIRRPRTLVRTARAVRALYDRLWLADPTAHGVPATSAARAHTFAADRSWAPPGAWDEDAIDDPAAHPDWTGECGTVTGFNIHARIGVPACEPCRAAKNARRAELKTEQQTAA